MTTVANTGDITVNQPVSFIKMQGLGNDFIIVDRRAQPVDIALLNVAGLADRERGIGCDQLILLDGSANADIAMTIFNADGGRVAACGNASRCVGRLLMEETGKDTVTIATEAGILRASRAPDGGISVLLPPPVLDWQAIPLVREADTLHLPFSVDPYGSPCAVSVGNPHMVFFVENVQAVPLADIGPELEHHPLFPQRANVEFVQVDAPDHLTMRVWERGAGITQACGTGACASLVAAVRRSLAGRKATVQMPGGSLQIEWQPQGGIVMTGDAREDYRGTFDLTAFLA